MKLIAIKDTVKSVAEAISNILNIDVIIVDREYTIIGNTYKHMESNKIFVTDESIIGGVMATGRRNSEINTKSSEECNTCEFRDVCVIEGVVAVPITYEETVVGGIGIIIKRMDSLKEVGQTVEEIFEFLENMADLISSKLRNVEDIRNMNLIKQQRELIIESINDAVVYVDNEGRIKYCNEMFKQHFRISVPTVGKLITDIIPHRVIEQFLFNRRNIENHIFVSGNSHKFSGLLDCINMKVNDELHGALMIFRKIEEIFKEINELSNNKPLHTFKQITRQDQRSLKVFEEAKKIAIRDGHVLIQGETGTGKRELAQAIHNFSDRKDGYFLQVHCSGLSLDEFQYELFGISGTRNHLGKFELANEGTVFFDEAAELPIEIQNTLLHYLNYGRMELEKGVVIDNVDVRIIAGTSQNIRSLVDSGRFNEELYYRLNMNAVALPAVRSMEPGAFEDLVKGFAVRYGNAFNKQIEGVDPKAMALLREHQWPGNIRELERVVERLVYRTDGVVIGEASVRALQSLGNEPEELEEIKTFEEYEKEIISRALRKYNTYKNSKEIVADKLGIGTATLYRKIKKYDLN